MTDIPQSLDKQSINFPVEKPKVINFITGSAHFGLVSGTNPGWEKTPQAEKFYLVPNPTAKNFPLAQQALLDYAEKTGFNRIKIITIMVRSGKQMKSVTVTGLAFDDPEAELTKQLLADNKPRPSRFGYNIPSFPALERTVLNGIKEVPAATASILTAVGKRLLPNPPTLIRDGETILAVSRWLNGAWNRGKNGVGSIPSWHLDEKLLTDENYLAAVINAAEIAGQLHPLKPEQIREYREDALISLGQEYVDYCQSKSYQPETAKKMLAALRAAAGADIADQAVMAAAIIPLLNRDSIIGKTPTSPLKLEALTLPGLEVTSNHNNVDAALFLAISREARRQGLGTNEEQLGFLFWETVFHSYLPALELGFASIAGAIFDIPAFIILQAKLLQPPTVTASPETLAAAFAGSVMASILWKGTLTGILLLDNEFRQECKRFIGAGINLISAWHQYLITGQVEGTPKLTNQA
jgi:hypothetical protein